MYINFVVTNIIPTYRLFIHYRICCTSGVNENIQVINDGRRAGLNSRMQESKRNRLKGIKILTVPFMVILMLVKDSLSFE